MVLSIEACGCCSKSSSVSNLTGLRPWSIVAYFPKATSSAYISSASSASCLGSIAPTRSTETTSTLKGKATLGGNFVWLHHG